MQQNLGQLPQGSQQQPMQVQQQQQQYGQPQQQFVQPIAQPVQRLPNGPAPCCSRPPAGEPEGWYHWCIASIVMHSISLFFLGFYIWCIWLAFLLSVICGSVILCCGSRHAQSYQANCICQAIAAIFDAIAIAYWIAMLATYDSNEYSYGSFGFIIWTLILSSLCFMSAIMCSVGSHTAAKYQRTLPQHQIVVAISNVNQPIQTQQMSYQVGPNGQMIPVQSTSVAVQPMYPAQQMYVQQPGPQMVYVGAPAHVQQQQEIPPLSQPPMAYASQVEYNAKM